MKASSGVSKENEYCDDISWMIHESNHLESRNDRNISATHLEVATISGTNSSLQDTAT